MKSLHPLPHDGLTAAGGTTALYAALSKHPQIVKPFFNVQEEHHVSKEIHFFDTDEWY